MADVTVKRVEEMDRYKGEGTGGQFVYAGKSLGIGAWGMNVVEMPPRWEGYPEHDHQKDGQEEVYVVLEGSAVLIAEGSERKVSAGEMIRVPPDVKRKFVTRDEGVVLLALGGTPGKAYQSS